MHTFQQTYGVLGSNSNSYQYADVFFSFSLKEEATLQNGLRQTCPRLPILATTASATMRSSRYTFYRNTLDLNNNYKYSRKTMILLYTHPRWIIQTDVFEEDMVDV